MAIGRNGRLVSRMRNHDVENCGVGLEISGIEVGRSVCLGVFDAKFPLLRRSLEGSAHNLCGETAVRLGTLGTLGTTWDAWDGPGRSVTVGDGL